MLLILLNNVNLLQLQDLIHYEIYLIYSIIMLGI
jgi:hypothetical protein